MINPHSTAKILISCLEINVRNITTILKRAFGKLSPETFLNPPGSTNPPISTPLQSFARRRFTKIPMKIPTPSHRKHDFGSVIRLGGGLRSSVRVFHRNSRICASAMQAPNIDARLIYFHSRGLFSALYY